MTGPSGPGGLPPGKAGSLENAPATKPVEGAATRERLDRQMQRQRHEMTLPRTDTGRSEPARVASTQWPSDHEALLKAQRLRTHGTHRRYAPLMAPGGTGTSIGVEPRIGDRQTGLETARTRLAETERQAAEGGTTMVSKVKDVRVATSRLPQRETDKPQNEPEPDF